VVDAAGKEKKQEKDKCGRQEEKMKKKAKKRLGCVFLFFSPFNHNLQGACTILLAKCA